MSRVARARAQRQSAPVRSALLAVALVVTACAPSGEDPLTRLSTHAPPSGEYRVRYLEPPWELVSTSGTTAFLRIQSNAMAIAGIEGGAGKYELTVTVERGDPVTRANDELRAARGRGEEILGDGVRTVETDEGVVGAEVLSRGIDPLTMSPRHRRIAFLPVDAARVVRLDFDATPELDTAEVDAMIAAIGIGAGG